MANPNLNTATTVSAVNNSVLLSSTAETQLVSNPAGSGKLMQIDGLWAANVSASSGSTLTVTLYRNATNTGTAYRIASTVNIALNSTLGIVTKANGVTLMEGQSIYVNASVANVLSVNCFYKEFS
jgi:hypothetical protein